MSYVLCGDFFLNKIKRDKVSAVKAKAEELDACVWLNDEVDFDACPDVLQMLHENPSPYQNSTFLIAGNPYACNGGDLLEPYSLYSHEELFPNGEDRDTFNKIRAENLQRLKTLIKCVMEKLQPEHIHIFVTEEYDTDFRILDITLDEMIEDILRQLIGRGGFIDSALYKL
jgi:hypothetical protein